MKKLYAVIAALGLGLMVSVGQASADLGSSKSLADRLTVMKAFKANFTQTVMDGRGVMLQSTHGEIAVKRPGLFYWQTQPPLEQTLVSDGHQLWSYDPDLEQVTVQAVDQRLSQTPALLLSGEVEDLAASYAVTGVKLGEQQWQFQLLPKDPDTLFEQLILTFTNGTLVQMNLLDSLGQRSILEFTNVQINPVLDPALFQFTPPAGVDVIIQ